MNGGKILIKFNRIEVRNFMSVGNDGITFDYATGMFYCYGINHDVSSDEDGTPISNGSGKTVCLVDAPLFALYGRTQRNINKSEIINIQNDGECSVKLYFEKDGVDYAIERGIKPDKLIIYKDGEPEKEESKKREANRIIVDELLDGISFEVFKNLIVLNGTTSKHFFEYGKNEKRSFINEVFRLGFLDYLQDNLTDEVKEKKSKIEILEIQKEAKVKEAERLSGLYEATENGDVLDISLEALQTKLTDESQKFIMTNARTHQLETTVFQSNIADYNLKYDAASSKLEATNKDIAQLQFSTGELSRQLDKLRNDWNRVTTQNVCVHCTQPIPENLKQKLQTEIKESATKIKAELDTINNEKTNKEAAVFKMRCWVDAAREAIREYDVKCSELIHSKQLIEQYENQIKNKVSNPNSLDKINTEIANVQKEMEDITKILDESKADYNVHKICRDIVSDKNFYGYYISMFRKYLNQTINQYLEKLASPHRVQFNNDLTAEVSNGELKIHSYDNLSTGEKAKVNLSLLISFFDVLHAFHRMRTNILVLDEVLDLGIDSEGVKLLHNVLKEKVEENKELGIYIVSHKNAESTFTDQEGIKKVVFEKRNGFTSLKA